MLKLDYMKDELIEMYNGGMSVYAISKEIGEYEQAIMNVIRKYIHVPAKKEYEINEDYFEIIDTVDKAYFFGLIAADGSIVEYRPGFYQMTISLQVEDKHILEKLRIRTQADTPVREYTAKRNNAPDYDYARFVTINQSFCKHLINHNITTHKAKILPDLIPGIEEDYIIDFIRGYFDGDGSVYKTITSGINQKNYVSFRGTKELLTSIKDYLSIDGGKIRYGKGSIEGSGSYEWKFGAKQDVIRFKEMLYHDNVEDLYLSRKKEEFIW